jgi:hypothetical protein
MKKPDTKAASVLFGVELETVIPAGCGVQVGNYHRGIQVTGGLRKSDGTVVTAPKFNRNAWRAEHDGSIRGSGVACEFVSPILHGEAGVAALCEFVEFTTTIGATVNDYCGLRSHAFTASASKRIKCRNLIVGKPA